jgi:hypothetical protein
MSNTIKIKDFLQLPKYGGTTPVTTANNAKSKLAVDADGFVVEADLIPTLQNVLDAGSTWITASDIDFGITTTGDSYIVSDIIAIGATNTASFSGLNGATITTTTGNIGITCSTSGSVIIKGGGTSGTVEIEGGSAGAVHIDSVVRLKNLGADPTSPTPVKGHMYFNTATNKFRGYNGTSWVDLG